MKKTASRRSSDLEKEWQNWIEARLRGRVRGQFPHADKLLEQRKKKGRSGLNSNVPFGLGDPGTPPKWPGRSNRRTGRGKK